MNSRRTFLAASAFATAATGVLRRPAAAATPTFDRTAFEERIRAPFRHRQAFASPLVGEGAVLGFIFNSLNAYETGFGEGPGTLHAAAVLYHTGVALALDDDTWRRFNVADVVRRAGDHVTATSTDGNPFIRAPRGWTFDELAARNASFFVCSNALTDLARRCASSIDTFAAHLLPGMMLVPAGVAAINALQEEHFTLFQAQV